MPTNAGIGGNSLPRYLTSFIGRDREIAEISALLTRDDVRLLTLLGPGGAGKTRLAVETVARLGDTFHDAVWFVPLVAVRDPALMLPAIAEALGLQQARTASAADAIIHVLGDRQTLLLIDNVEHLTAAAPCLGQLLAACPNLTMLVTSRVALHITGEHLFMLPPLETPRRRGVSPEQLRSFESVQLFLQRSSASGRSLEVTNENADDIAEICRRLDGLPLALELAAARSGLLAPGALLARLGPALLSDGPHDAPERHRSMHDAIAWSYDLLSDEEQVVFRRLAVFRGGFWLPAAEAVIDLPIDVMHAIASLAAKSLLVPLPSDTGEPRFTMLETLREFGIEQLAMEGEAQAARDRHAAFFLQEALDGEYAWCMFIEEGMMWLNRLQADHANLREALQWLYDSGNITTCLRMAAALTALWILRGHHREGQLWLERLLPDKRVDSDTVRARGLLTLSWISNQQQRMDEAFALAERALALSRDHAIPLVKIGAHVLSGIAARDLGQHALANQRLEHALAYMLALHEPGWLGNWVQNTLVVFGDIELMDGNIDASEERFRQAWNTDLSHGYEPGTSFIYSNAVIAGLGRVARVKGDAALALHHLQKNLYLTHRYNNISWVIGAICSVAGALSQLGQPVQAARLFGASEALMEEYGYEFAVAFDMERAAGLPEPWAREDEPCGPYETLRNTLRPRTVAFLPASITVDALDRAWAEGRTMSLEDAVAEALAATPDPPSVQGENIAHGLSPRQVEVLRLIADGYSNRAIADILSLSERTVEHHITHILARLELDSRTAAATYALRTGIL